MKGEIKIILWIFLLYYFFWDPHHKHEKWNSRNWEKMQPLKSKHQSLEMTD
jgi:hypothetical protein